MNLFWNFLRLHPFIHLDRFLSGVENHKALRTVADVRLRFSAQFHVLRYVQVIGELLQELFTGKQRRSSPSLAERRRHLLSQLQTHPQQAPLDRPYRYPQSFCDILIPSAFRCRAIQKRFGQTTQKTSGRLETPRDRSAPRWPDPI